jgi:hypothetical protein
MHSEKGQALPLAILALTIGTLVIAPFLGHAGSSLIGSRTYAEAISYQNASDAGVEHAIWSLTKGTLAEQLPSPGDEITYQLGETLNGVNTTVTVTANATGGGGGTGSITDTIIDNFNFGPSGGETPAIVPVAGDVYVIAYGDWNNDGWVKTVNIDADGIIADTAIDVLEFDNRDGYTPDIIHVSGNTYAIAYRSSGNDGFIKTVSIAASGDISNSVIDALEFDNRNCYEPRIIQVSGSVYAIAYRGSGNDGFVKTVQIAANGYISNYVIDTLEFDNRNGYEPDIIQASSNVFAIAYRGSSNDGFIKTISIAASGNIGNSIIDIYEFNPHDCYYPNIINVSGDVFAISYTGSSTPNGDWWGGILTTVSIAVNGTITKSTIDEIVFDADAGDYSDMVYVDSNVYAIVYTGGNSRGTMKTVSIAADGTITDTVTDTLVFENNSGFYPAITGIDNDTYAIVYTGTNQWIGVLKVVEISGGSTTATYRIVSTAGGITIRAFVNADNTTASIVSWQTE